MNPLMLLIFIILVIILILQIYHIFFKKNNCPCTLNSKEVLHDAMASKKCYGKSGARSSAYACPDSSGDPVTQATLVKGVTSSFKVPVIKWVTPDPNFFTYVSAELTGPLVTVLITTGSCHYVKPGSRPGGTFYNCSPMSAISSQSGVCSSSHGCTPNSHVNYSHTSMDQGHMVSAHEAGTFTSLHNDDDSWRQQQSFSMCNIWPQGERMNETYWQHLEFTCDAYAMTRKMCHNIRTHICTWPRYLYTSWRREEEELTSFYGIMWAT